MVENLSFCKKMKKKKNWIFLVLFGYSCLVELNDLNLF